MMQRAWPDIVEAMKSRSRMLWMLIKGNVEVTGFDGQTLSLAFSNDGARSTFANRSGERALGEAVQDVLGMQVRFDLGAQSGAPQRQTTPQGPPPSQGGGSPPKAEGRAEPPAPAPSQPDPQDTPEPPDDEWQPPEEEPPPSEWDHPRAPDHSLTPAPVEPEQRTSHTSPSEAGESREPPAKPVVPAFARRAAASPPPGVTGSPEPSSAPPAGPGAGIRNRLATRRSAAPPWEAPQEPQEDLYDSSPPPDWAEAQPPTVGEEDIASEDDADLEHSGVFGRRAIERLLGGVLLEERRLDQP